MTKTTMATTTLEEILSQVQSPSRGLLLGSVVEVAEGGRRKRSMRSGRVCFATERVTGRLFGMTHLLAGTCPFGAGAT